MTGFLDCTYGLLPTSKREIVTHSAGPVEAFDKTIQVNLRGVFLCYKHAAQQMVKQGRGGRIMGEYQEKLVARI